MPARILPLCRAAVLLAGMVWLLCLPGWAMSPSPPPKPVAYTSFVFVAREGTFGYNVYADGRLLIYQPMVPGGSGSLGFASEACARKAVALVLRRLRAGQVAYTPTLTELRAVGAI